MKYRVELGDLGCIDIEAKSMAGAIVLALKSVREDDYDDVFDEAFDPDDSFESLDLRRVVVHRLAPTDEERKMMEMVNGHPDSPFRGMIDMHEHPK